MREMAASQAVKAVAMMDKLGTLASGARARGVMVSKAVMGATLISKAVKVVGMRMIPFLLFRCRATIAVAVAVGEEPVVGEERDPERGGRGRGVHSAQQSYGPAGHGQFPPGRGPGTAGPISGRGGPGGPVGYGGPAASPARRPQIAPPGGVFARALNDTFR